MADDNSNPTDKRAEVLERIWIAQAEALASLLENTDPSDMQAATLNVARAFLSDNKVNLGTLGTLGGKPDDPKMAALADKVQAIIEGDVSLTFNDDGRIIASEPAAYSPPDDLPDPVLPRVGNLRGK